MPVGILHHSLHFERKCGRWEQSRVEKKPERRSEYCRVEHRLPLRERSKIQPWWLFQAGLRAQRLPTGCDFPTVDGQCPAATFVSLTAAGQPRILTGFPIKRFVAKAYRGRFRVAHARMAATLAPTGTTHETASRSNSTCLNDGVHPTRWTKMRHTHEAAPN